MLKQDARLKVKVQAHVSSTQGYLTLTRMIGRWVVTLGWQIKKK
jgi:hypothetical protein